MPADAAPSPAEPPDDRAGRLRQASDPAHPVRQPADDGQRSADPPHRPADRRHVLGQVGERLASEHYQRLGFEVLERNYRSQAGELDLIVYDGHTIVFVEVKTRRSGGLDPIESIGVGKQRRLRRLAAGWLTDRSDAPRAGELRFDAVGIVIDGRGRLVALDQREAIL